jgi:hypothetical protein
MFRVSLTINKVCVPTCTNSIGLLLEIGNCNVLRWRGFVFCEVGPEYLKFTIYNNFSL